MDVFEAIHAILNPSDEGLRRLVRSEHEIFLPYFDLTKCSIKVAAECALEANQKNFYKSFCKSIDGKPKKIRTPFSAVLEMDGHTKSHDDRKAAFLRWMGLVKSKKFNGRLALYIWKRIPGTIECTMEEEYELAKAFKGLSYAPSEDFFKLVKCNDRLDSWADLIAHTFDLERHYHRAPIYEDVCLMKAVVRRLFEKVCHDALCHVDEFEAFVKNPEIVKYYKDMYEVNGVMNT